ncbi:hypothetical protein SFPGR_25510 [Sulfuriferula plumbiphila]|nr:hypothetical protein SFPGR_25510 [Sulfuriferula plumbiphila]
MAVTAKTARGAARKPGGAPARCTVPAFLFVSPHEGVAQRSWESHSMASWKAQRITEVSRTRIASMAIQADGQQIRAAWTAKKIKSMKGKAS